MEFTRKIVKGTSPQEDKIIAIFEKLNDSNNRTRIFYGDLKKTFIVSAEKFATYRRKPRTCKYILIKYDKTKYATLKEQYEQTYMEAVLLKDLTEGQINLFRTGSTAKTALQLFYDLCHPEEPEEIDLKEMEILEKCSRGALIYGIPYKGKGYKYDIVSAYPAVMTSKNLHIPYGKPEYSTMTIDEFNALKFFRTGVYHVKVVDPDFRVFRENSHDWYTHTDLNHAMLKLKYKLELIEDDEVNAIIYTKIKSISNVFKPFIDYLFQYKKKGIKEIKKYITALWGALCQKNDLDVPANVIHDNKELFSTKPMFKNLEEQFDMAQHVSVVYDKQKRYETNFARIEPFIVASCRMKISNIILPNIDKVVRCHTDGIILTSTIEHIELGDKLGDLKLEEVGSCEIIDAVTYDFNKIRHGRKVKVECLFKNIL